MITDPKTWHCAGLTQNTIPNTIAALGFVKCVESTDKQGGVIVIIIMSDGGRLSLEEASHQKNGFERNLINPRYT
jgi:hypothetical protein